MGVQYLLAILENISFPLKVVACQPNSLAY